MKKRLAIIALVLGVMFGTMTLPAFAAGVSAPKATGDVGYDAYGIQRYATFNAITTSTQCSVKWDITGSWNIAFVLTGDATLYTHHTTFSQVGSSVSGSGGYPVVGLDQYSWNVTTGGVTGGTIDLTIDYSVGAVGTTMHMTGTIAPDGSMSGTWSDDLNRPGADRTGTWSSTAGSATRVVAGCAAKGTFNYSDVHGNWYTVDVQFAKVDGADAWFAGPVVAGNVGSGSWLFAKVRDDGEPSSADRIWGSFASQAEAMNGVALEAAPADGPFAITSGNLQVH